MAERIAEIDIPDTPLVAEATELVRATESPLLFDHSRRVFLFGSLEGRQRGLTPDPELLYVGALFHDLGLTERYRSTDNRFEIDGANLARDFLLDQGRSEAEARTVWLGIALHTTPGVPDFLDPEVALVQAGVETDVLGLHLDMLTTEQVDAVTHAHPRTKFKEGILQAFTDGMKDRPDTTFGTMNDDVLAHFVPGFARQDFVEIIEGSDWAE
jgi:hypothetical protein